jgi:predicted transcriptional regulator
MSETSSQSLLQHLTAEIVAAHAAHNQVTSEALLQLIENVYRALAGTEKTPAGVAEPAVPVKRSVFPGHIFCLECGQKLKMLKRHLQSDHRLRPEQYRKKWDLPPSYPMVAPDYAGRRSELAKQIGLGRKPAGERPEPARKELKPAIRMGRSRRAAGSK